MITMVILACCLFLASAVRQQQYGSRYVGYRGMSSSGSGSDGQMMGFDGIYGGQNSRQHYYGGSQNSYGQNGGNGKEYDGMQTLYGQNGNRGHQASSMGNVYGQNKNTQQQYGGIRLRRGVMGQHRGGLGQRYGSIGETYGESNDMTQMYGGGMLNSHRQNEGNIEEQYGGMASMYNGQYGGIDNNYGQMNTKQHYNSMGDKYGQDDRMSQVYPGMQNLYGLGGLMAGSGLSGGSGTFTMRGGSGIGHRFGARGSMYYYFHNK